MLQTKSQTVEEAANELINMLCDVEPPEPPAEAAEEEDQGFDEEEGGEGKKGYLYQSLKINSVPHTV
jgi:hypothetical protein